MIQERISLVHPIYRNDPLNLYLVLGNEKALLMDTGCGLYPIKPIVEDIKGNRKLDVINTHFHWDHVLGNKEFEEVKIHRNEIKKISKPYDVSFFKSSPNELAKRYAKYNYLIPPAPKTAIIKEGDIFDLGGITIKVLHTPGHSPGSICLQSNKGELFTTDVAYYGDIFLPTINQMDVVIESLTRLVKIFENKSIDLYPSHCAYPCSIDLILNLREGIMNISDLWETRIYSEFFSSWIIKDSPFRYIISKS